MQYFPSLTGIRGLGLICVLVSHAHFPWLPGGFLAVDMFFVLSGFLISALLLKEKSQSGRISLADFYRRRAARLLPAFLLVCVAFIAALSLRDGLSGLQKAAQEAGIALTYMSNWSRALGWDSLYYLGHTWSLAIEEQFYILWPIALMGMLRYRWINPWLVAVALAISAALWRGYLTNQGASVDRLYNGLDTRLDGLMLGAALGILWAKGHIATLHQALPEKAWQVLSLLTLAMIVWLLFNIRFWFDPRLYSGGLLHAYQWLAVAFIISLLGSQRGPCHRLFSFRPVVWLGTISYGAYLWHFPIYRFMQDIQLPPLQVLLLAGAASLALAELSWRYVEEPLILRAKGQRRVSKPLPSTSPISTVAVD